MMARDILIEWSKSIKILTFADSSACIKELVLGQVSMSTQPCYSSLTVSVNRLLIARAFHAMCISNICPLCLLFV